MPNMDDIAYFDSSSYSHRGGIWSDAGRKQREASSFRSADADIASVNSEPAVNIPPTIDISPDPLDEATSASDPPEPAVIRSSATMPHHSSSPSHSRTRRRTWFAGVESTPHSRHASDNHEPLLEESAEREDSSTVPTKPHSVPPPSTDSHRVTPSYGGPVPREAETHRREPSSSNRQTDVSDSLPSSSTASRSFPDSSGISLARSSRESLPKHNPPPSPTNFLSTLKARAKDEQTILKAKDTMRKWGVNWAGLMKDSNDDDATDFAPDVIGERLRTQSASVAQKPSLSFADIQAAVAQRRGRPGEYQDGDRLGSRSSSPVTIPQPATPKSRSVSYSSQAQVESPQSVASTSSLAHSPHGRTTPEPSSVDTAARSPKPGPIQLQPQARTMSIPGIHAKNRGEVMSMGHSAPDRPPSPKNVAPAIQSVYRMWKSNSTNSDPSSSSTDSAEPKAETVSHSPPTSRPKKERIASESGSLSPTSSPRIPSTLPSVAASHTSVSRPPLSPPKLSPDLTQKSFDALKSIVTKDEENRRASLEMSSPPSHPRKASLSGFNPEHTEGPSSQSDPDFSSPFL